MLDAREGFVDLGRPHLIHGEDGLSLPRAKPEAGELLECSDVLVIDAKGGISVSPPAAIEFPERLPDPRGSGMDEVSGRSGLRGLDSRNQPVDQPFAERARLPDALSTCSRMKRNLL